MKRVLIVTALLIVLWVVGSAIFEWPPLWHYAGSSCNSCINNLRVLDSMKGQWAMDTKQTNGTPVDPVQLEHYFRTNGYRWGYHWNIPRCPSGGTYTWGNIGQPPTCSIVTNTPGVKERVGLLGWRWKIWPSQGAHALPN